jgi:ABC-2 type transport system ATP-binding protein
MSALVARKHVVCATSVAIGEIRSWTNVQGVREEHDRLHITTADAESVVRRLLAADTALRELEVRRAGLAEAFSELTQEVA